MKRSFGKCPKTPELDVNDGDEGKNKRARRGIRN
jgi:hypothetical protein